MLRGDRLDRLLGSVRWPAMAGMTIVGFVCGFVQNEGDPLKALPLAISPWVGFLLRGIVDDLTGS